MLLPEARQQSSNPASGEQCKLIKSGSDDLTIAAKTRI
jgi:hypothetical protein